MISTMFWFIMPMGSTAFSCSFSTIQETQTQTAASNIIQLQTGSLIYLCS